MRFFKFTVNGKECMTDKDMNLLRFLRDDLGLHSCRDGCSEGACGSCTVDIDGRAVKACTMKTSRAAGCSILTVEGLPEREKEAFVYAFGACGAVQCGFCTPGMVMAGHALLRHNPDPSEKEIMAAIRGNLCRCTGYKKIIEAISLTAALLRGDAVIDPGLERGDSFGIGSSVMRVDVRRKVLGYGKYPDDIDKNFFIPEGSFRAGQLERELSGAFGYPVSLTAGMAVPYKNDPGACRYMVVEAGLPPLAYAGAVRSRYPRARVLKIDTSRARALPGVIGILTAEDVPVNKVGHIQQDWDVMIREGDITRCVGDALCLVVAVSQKALEQARELVEVEYEQLPPVTGIADARRDDAPKIHSGGNLCQSRHVVRGDAAKALRESKYVVSETFRTPFTEHAFLEPECAAAFPYKDGVKILSSDQGAYDTRKEVSYMLDWDPDRVVVENMLVGGGFGGKEDVSVQHLAALAAVKFHRPVKIKLSRQESIRFHPKRHAMEGTFTLGCDENGILTGLDCEINFDTGAYASLCGPVLERACTHSVGPYRYQNTDIRGYGWYTNNPPAGAFRGFGVCQSEFALEVLLDLLAQKAGISPWEIRWRNAIEPGQVLPNGQIADVSTALKETLQAVKPYYEANPGRAGIACAMKNSGVGVGLPDKGRVRICVEHGQAVIYTAASDIGQGCATVFCQDLAQATGLPLSAIRLAIASTENAPDSGTTSGSRQTLLTGEAVRGAAFLLRDALTAADMAKKKGTSVLDELKEASGYNHPRQADNTAAAYGTGTDNAPGGSPYVSPVIHVEADSRIWASGTGLNQGTYGTGGSQTAICGAPAENPAGLLSMLEGLTFAYEYFEPTDKLGADVPYPKSHVAYSYASNVVILDEQGQVSDIYAAFDAGKVINPGAIQGQIEGGTLMSMGYALTEDFPLDNCVPQVKFGTLGLMRATQIPRIHAICVEKEQLLGTAYGAKGIGEISSIPTAPAIAGAFLAKDGKLRTSLPLEDTIYKKKRRS